MTEPDTAAGSSQRIVDPRPQRRLANPADPDDVYDGQVHLDALADTGDAYTSFHGWVLTCCWCLAQARGRTKAEAVGGMQEHYDRVCGKGKAGEIRA